MEIAEFRSIQSNQPYGLNGVTSNEYGLETTSTSAISVALVSSSNKYLEASAKEREALTNPIKVSPQVLKRLANNRETAFMVLHHAADQALNVIQNNASEEKLSVFVEDTLEKVSQATEGRVGAREYKKTGNRDVDNLLEIFTMAKEDFDEVMAAIKKITDYYEMVVELKRHLEKPPKSLEGAEPGEVEIDFDKEITEFMGEELIPPIPLGQLIDSVQSKFADGDDGLLFDNVTEWQAEQLLAALGFGEMASNGDGTVDLRINMHSMTQFKDTYETAKQEQYDSENGRLSSAQYQAMLTGLTSAQTTADSMISKVGNGGSFAQQNQENLIKLLTAIMASDMELLRTTNS